MANLPTPQVTNQVIQNDTTGVVDFLQYRGHQLIASSEHDYGLGSDFKVVASSDFGHGPELVAQSQSTGELDFLRIDDTGNLTSSFMTSFGLPAVHGAGFFGGTQQVLVSQLSDGSIDFLQFDGNHNFTASDLVPNTIGLAQLRGSGTGTGSRNEIAASLQTASNISSLVTQLADGTIDLIGMTGDFGTGTLAFSGSSLLSQTTESGVVGAVDQTNPFNFNFQDSNSLNQGMQFLTTASDGNYDALYVDSGYGTGGVEGTFYASNLTQGFAGWSLVDGGAIANEIFPITYSSA